MSPRVRAVVLNYNGGRHVVDCVAALRATAWPAGDLEIVVVDNASSDGSDGEIRERFPDVEIRPTGANLGFPANNVAMADLDDVDFVALVNNDAFVDPGWLGPLIDALHADEGLGAACPRILFAPRFLDLTLISPTFRPGTGDGRDLGVRLSGIEVAVSGEPYDVVNNVGSLLIEGGYGADRGFLQQDEGQFDEPAEVFAWCGGGVLLRKRYLEEVGLFDERFFLYYEDTDLAWRGRSRGWRYGYVPESRFRHIHAASSGEGSALFQHFVERNRLLMLVKNAPFGLAAGAVGRYVLITASYARRDVVSPMLRAHRPNTVLLRRRTKSFLAFLRLLPAMLVARFRNRRQQVVDDAELVGWAVPQP